MPDHAGMRTRLALFVIFLAVCAVAAGLRLAYWQVARGDELRAKALIQIARPVEVASVRGSIVDRNGTILALTSYRDRLAAYPKLIAEADREGIVTTLAGILGLGSNEAAALDARVAEGGEYILVDRALTDEQSAAVRAAIADGTLTAVGLETEPYRVYPNAGGAPGTTLASHVLGFVSSDGSGSYGIEQRYDELLAGSPALLEAARDPFGRPLGSSARILDPGEPGADLALTIDAGLQLQLEKELYAAWVADRAKRVSGVVMDPHTGAILAWATVPGYDANDYAADWARDPSRFTDPIVSSGYEPGSVMKMLTAAAALDAGTVGPSKVVYDSPSLEFDPYVVRNADHKGMGRLSFRDVIAYSRNVATARVASRLGRGTAASADVLYGMWARLGIGDRTGIDLAGESVGMVADPATSPWAPMDLANRSFGQAVLVTQAQLITAYAPMVNGGYAVTPHLVTRIGEEPLLPPEPRRVFGPTVAGQLRGLLDHVTGSVWWYAQGSLIRGYQVGGKTGTAQIWRPRLGSYSARTFNFSFEGYVGGDEPAVLISVRIEEATSLTREQGQVAINLTSYELFRRIAMNVISTLGIPRASDRKAGLPEPLSDADRVLTPDRYAEHRRQLQSGDDPRPEVWDRYLPRAKAGDRGAAGDGAGDGAGDPVEGDPGSADAAGGGELPPPAAGG